MLLTILLFLFSQSPNTDFFINAQDFVAKYARNSLVNYKAVKASPEQLNSLVQQIENFDLESAQSANERKAFLINAYNLICIKQVVDHYPNINSPNEISGFFDKTKFNIAGKLMTMDELEHDVIFDEFKDPRIHFALVCAAISCPILDMYNPGLIDADLEVAMENFLNSEVNIEVKNGKTKVSEIFKWYKDDFGGESGISNYINSRRYASVPQEIEFMPYNWSLNDLND